MPSADATSASALPANNPSAFASKYTSSHEGRKERKKRERPGHGHMHGVAAKERRGLGHWDQEQGSRVGDERSRAFYTLPMASSALVSTSIILRHSLRRWMMTSDSFMTSSYERFL